MMTPRPVIQQLHWRENDHVGDVLGSIIRRACHKLVQCIRAHGDPTTWRDLTSQPPHHLALHPLCEGPIAKGPLARLPCLPKRSATAFRFLCPMRILDLVVLHLVQQLLALHRKRHHGVLHHRHRNIRHRHDSHWIGSEDLVTTTRLAITPCQQEWLEPKWLRTNDDDGDDGDE